MNVVRTILWRKYEESTHEVVTYIFVFTCNFCRVVIRSLYHMDTIRRLYMRENESETHQTNCNMVLREVRQAGQETDEAGPRTQCHKDDLWVLLGLEFHVPIVRQGVDENGREFGVSRVVCVWLLKYEDVRERNIRVHDIVCRDRLVPACETRRSSCLFHALA